jgi:arylsulfatase A-like enzyme/Flp pilus assembly protein TadD
LGTGGPWWEGAARRVLAGRSPAPQDLNVVIFTLDTTRADRLGCYGFKGIDTPHIDALARRGVLFEQATSTVPLTFPSHASIFTGLLPPHHGVRDNGGFFLDASKTTLATRLKAAGYATGAFIGAWVLEAKWGLNQGFDSYSDKFELSKYKVLSLGTVQKKGDEVMDDALAWLEGVKSRKFFAWVHLYDPHEPYDPPEPFKSRYGAHSYVGEIAYTDQVVGRLLDWLDAQKLSGRTLVVLTADHGEGLGEHGETNHAYFLYDSTVHVPLIVATPWGDTGRSRAQVTSVDILPTVLDLLGLPPEPGIDGSSLGRVVLDPSVEPGHSAYAETYFPRYHFGWQQLRALRNGRYKFVEAPTPELYDLQQDPGELTNIYKAYSKTAEEMRTSLLSLAKESRKASPEREKLDPDTLQRLAALGYVGNVADVDPEKVLPDPKTKIHVFEMMGDAKEAAQADHLDEAIATMRKVLAEEPGMVDAYLTLGNWLVKAQRPDEARAAFQHTLALKPDNELAMTNLANLYRSEGKADAAVEGYKSALKLDAKSPQTWFQLATLYLDLGRVDDAERTFRQAVEKNPQMGAGYNSLGVIAFARGRTPEAETLVRKALELEPRVRTGRYNLARILETRGDLAGAEGLYRAELETYPDHGRAHFNLAQLLSAKGDHDGYLRELRQGVEKAPEFGPSYFFLARDELAAGRLDAASDLASRGLAVDTLSEVAPLGHYVLADVYNREHQPAKAEAEVREARRLEAELRRNPSPRI